MTTLLKDGKVGKKKSDRDCKTEAFAETVFQDESSVGRDSPLAKANLQKGSPAHALNPLCQ